MPWTKEEIESQILTLAGVDVELSTQFHNTVALVEELDRLAAILKGEMKNNTGNALASIISRLNNHLIQAESTMIDLRHKVKAFSDRPKLGEMDFDELCALAEKNGVELLLPDSALHLRELVPKYTSLQDPGATFAVQTEIESLMKQFANGTITRKQLLQRMDELKKGPGQPVNTTPPQVAVQVDSSKFTQSQKDLSDKITGVLEAKMKKELTTAEGLLEEAILSGKLEVTPEELGMTPVPGVKYVATKETIEKLASDLKRERQKALGLLLGNQP